VKFTTEAEYNRSCGTTKAANLLPQNLEIFFRTNLDRKSVAYSDNHTQEMNS